MLNSNGKNDLHPKKEIERMKTQLIHKHPILQQIA